MKIESLKPEKDMIRTDLTKPNGEKLSWFDPISDWLEAAKLKDGKATQLTEVTKPQ